MERLRYARKWRWAIEAITDIPFLQAKKEVVSAAKFRSRDIEDVGVPANLHIGRRRKATKSAFLTTVSTSTITTPKRVLITSLQWMIFADLLPQFT